MLWGDPVNRFWKKVQRAAERARKGKIPKYMFSHKVNMALLKYDSRLHVECIVARPPEPEKIIITSGGDASAFDSVYRLRDAARPISGWGFVFLIPPSELHTIDVDDYTEVIVDHVSFHHSARGNRFDLDLYVKYWTPGDHYREGAARQLLLGRLGEVSFATRIGQIRYNSASKPEAQNAVPLKEIRSCLGL